MNPSSSTISGLFMGIILGFGIISWHHHMTNGQLFSLRDSEKRVLNEKVLESTKQNAEIHGPVNGLAQAAALTGGKESDLLVLPVLKNVVANMLNQLQLKDHNFGPGDTLTMSMEAEVKWEDYEYLKQFLSCESSDTVKYLDKVEGIMGGLFHPLEKFMTLRSVYNTVTSKMAEALNTVFSMRTMLFVLVDSVFLTVVLVFIRRLAISRTAAGILQQCLLLCLILGFGWEFYGQVEKARAKNAARLMQLPEMPRECNYDDLNAWETVVYHSRQLFRIGDDRCVEYFKANALDPVLDVSPASALFETVGKWGSVFTEALNTMLPFWLRPVIAVTIALLLPVLLFIGLFNFRIRTPLVSLEPVTVADGDLIPSMNNGSVKRMSISETDGEMPELEPIESMVDNEGNKKKLDEPSTAEDSQISNIDSDSDVELDD